MGVQISALPAPPPLVVYAPPRPGSDPAGGESAAGVTDMSKWLAILVAVVAIGAVACGGDEGGGDANGEPGGGAGTGDCPLEVAAECIDSGEIDGEPGPCDSAWTAYLDCVGQDCGAETMPAFLGCVENNCPEAMPCYEE